MISHHYIHLLFGSVVLTISTMQVNTGILRQLREAYPGLAGEILTDGGILVSRSPEQGAYSTW